MNTSTLLKVGAWALGVVASAVTGTAVVILFVFSNFQTKADASAAAEDAEKARVSDRSIFIGRLDRISDFVRDEFRITRAKNDSDTALLRARIDQVRDLVDTKGRK